VDNHLVSLRAKLERDPSTPRYLLTVHGVGYRLRGAGE
jgi:DNA-binding response OmpR family regulator